MKVAYLAQYACETYLQSLWLTSWFGSSSSSSGGGGGSNKQRDADVYTLQQSHKFPLQLDVYGGNCSFDYQQREQPSGHYQQHNSSSSNKQQQQQKSSAAASTTLKQSTLSIQRQGLKQQKLFKISTNIYETQFIESSAATTMDDMVYQQCSNQNSIYVLNAAGYGHDFGAAAATRREMNARTTNRGANVSNSIGASLSSSVVACSLQHKFKSFGTSTAATAAAGATINYVNPVATSMSTTMCSPATATLHKLFNCSSSSSSSSSVGGQNVSHRNQQQQLALPPLLAGSSKKKCTNVKSTLIAKKTKFLKFLEEEKWRSNNNLNAATHSSNSNEAVIYTASTSLAAHSSSKTNNNNNNNNNSSNSNSQESTWQQQQNKLNNWSMHNDNNKFQQQQQQQEQQPRYSHELYQEAAEILGLSCSLCDNCRCLDCQSGYFDCADDDDDESYSEQSFMDDEYDEYDYGYSYGQQEQQQQCEQTKVLTAEASALSQTEPASEPEPQQLCYAIDCQQQQQQLEHDKIYAGHTTTLTANETEFEAASNATASSEQESVQCVAIDFDLINITSSQVLQNCQTFNDLKFARSQT
ncbi:protein kinase 4 [Drosophila busckii]|uniref:protein kinase 4 n=1 Tax=Drosophila busckii TaxID=30019 RepID=UPI00083EEA00|nr:protein kinase 4 [Drosophila busckii]